MLLEIVMIAVFIVLGVGALLPVYWAWSMIAVYYWGSGMVPAAPLPCPKAAVILCLRGADPSLESCLQGLLQQDYPNYQIHIVVDHREDSAWEKVQAMLAIAKSAAVRVEVETLARHCPTCSLKVCAQLQAISRLDADVDVVVLIDADSIPAPDWLRALVAPLADPAVGAATGIRWFAPIDAGWGSLVRHIYNVGSYPQMFVFDHPWGGSLAVRAGVFRHSRLKERWRQALCEDSALAGPLRELGLKLVFVPAATNINQESITLAASLRFVQRQLLCVRLDHVDWPIVLAANMSNSLAVGALAIVGGISIYGERWDWAGVAGGLLVHFVAGLFSALNVAERVIRRNYRLRGLSIPPIVWSWKMFPAFLFTQIISMRYLWRARNLRQVVWRGVQYAIAGPSDIRLEKYEPYQPVDQASSKHHSAV